MKISILFCSTDDMVDVISARFQDALGTWRLPTNVPNGGENSRHEERISDNQLRRVGDEHRRRKAYSKEMEKKVCVPSLVCLLLVFLLRYHLHDF